MRVVAIVQARTSSTRLPAKVLAPVGRHCMIERLLGQLSGARTLDLVVLATSVDPSDDELAKRGAAFGVPVFRGDLQDVLGRYCAAAAKFDADVVVRITGDCPLHTPDTVDDVVSAFLAARVDYASNVDPYSRPNGLDVEVVRRDALEMAARVATEGSDREHVTPYIRRSAEFSKLRYSHADAIVGKPPRWTVDTQDDLDFARAVWERLDSMGPGPHSYAQVVLAAEEAGRRAPDELANRGYLRSLYQQSHGGKAPQLSHAVAQSWHARRARVVPASTRAGSKRDDAEAAVAGGCLERGAGPIVWDVDGNRYVDLSPAMLDQFLGYAHPEVDRVAGECAARGQAWSPGHPLEVQLAELLARLIPSAEMVRLYSDEGDALADAIRAACRHTEREGVVRCASGVSRAVDQQGVQTRSDPLTPTILRDAPTCSDPAALDELLSDSGNSIAAVILSPLDIPWPADAFARHAQIEARQHGALFVLDESRAGFHFGVGGAQELLDLTPDLAVFGRGIANGYPLSCIAGAESTMRTLGDVADGTRRPPGIVGIAAARAVLEILERGDVHRSMVHSGRMLTDGLRALVIEAELQTIALISGPPTLPRIAFGGAMEANEGNILGVLWRQEMRNRGTLAGSRLHVCAALDFASVEHVLRSCADAFKFIAELIGDGRDPRDAIDMGQQRVNVSS